MLPEAHYTDGRTAARRPVRLQPGRSALRLYDPAGALLDEWPWRSLRVAGEVYPGQPVYLRQRGKGEATLVLADPPALAALERASGRRLRGHWLLRPSMAMAVVWGVLLAVLVGGALWALPRLAGPLARQVPAHWEQALGDRMMARLAADQPFCAVPAGEAALRRLTERLLAGGETPFPIRVRVSPEPAVNAFALPGGNIVLLRGLLEAAQTPEEAAGVLAHEIAHVQERHPLRGALRVVGIGLVFRALTGSAAGLEEAAARGVATLLLFTYSRADERAADRGGLALLERAGLDGSALADFLERLAAGEGDGPRLPALLSTHPLSRERSAEMRRLAGPRPARPSATPALSPADWAALRAICG